MAGAKSIRIPWLSFRWVVTLLGFGGVVALLLFYLAGRFSAKVPAGGAGSGAGESGAGGGVAARVIEIPLTETAVGSIRAVHESSIAAKLTARVTRMEVKAGMRVERGALLMQLDDRDLKARQLQAQAALAAAEAQRTQARLDEERVAGLMKTGAANQQEYDRTATALQFAEAEVERNREALNEARAILDYATITAPFDGVVVDKRVDVGDTVMPGQIMMTLYDPASMQLIASVRESLAQRLKIGQEIGVRVDVLDKACGGQVSEIVPEAQSASRSFLVKVTGPCPEGIFAGMFGRLLIPNGVERVLVIPRAAIRRVGQIELVDVVSKGRVQRRAVRSGRELGEEVEILSGLRPGEEVLAHSTAREGA